MVGKERVERTYTFYDKKILIFVTNKTFIFVMYESTNAAQVLLL